MKVRFVEGLAKKNKDIMAKETIEFIENNPIVEVVAIKVEGFNLFFSPDEVEVFDETAKQAKNKKTVELGKGGKDDNGSNTDAQS